MISVDQIEFSAGLPQSPTLFVSRENGAKALVCFISGGNAGLLWLDGP
jgi:hypothetical protein